MGPGIDYYFTLLSPWAFLGHAPFMAIAARHGASINFKPVDIRQVFAASGGVLLGDRHPARQRYRMLELQRWRERRGVDLVLRPACYPFDIRLADRTAIALSAAGHDPQPFVAAAMAAVWLREIDLSGHAALAELLKGLGHDANLVLTGAQQDWSEAEYGRNTAEAVRVDAFGSPAYVLNGEVFWGQDRLDLLDDALASGRAPYMSEPARGT